MTARKGDYVEGYELHGANTSPTCGWVYSVQEQGDNTLYYIRADDGWNGLKKTILTSPVTLLDEHTKLPIGIL